MSRSFYCFWQQIDITPPKTRSPADAGLWVGGGGSGGLLCVACVSDDPLTDGA